MTDGGAFERANDYLLGTISETVSPRTSYKLDRMYAFLRELGDPHVAYPTIHVGGTSGKGSTSTMIAAALTAAGRRTGLHGRKVVVSLSPAWFFNRLAARADGYAGNFSQLQADELAFNTRLSLKLRQDAARRMLQYPATLKNRPLLKFAL